MKQVVAIITVLAGAAATIQVSRAADFVCTPQAIHQKYVFTKNLWAQLENNKAANLPANLDKVWDGNGDCSGDEDMSTFSFTTISELVQMHYLGDFMSSVYNTDMKEYALARQRVDDFWIAEGLVQKYAGRMPAAFMAEDSAIVKEMRSMDKRLTALGYPAKPAGK